MACQAEALAKAGGKCWTTIREANIVILGNQLVAELGVQMLQFVTSSFV
jgi:hypothetical protein